MTFVRQGEPFRWPSVPPSTDTDRLATDPLLGQLQSRLEPVLRIWLRERLPEPLVPGSFIFLSPAGGPPAPPDQQTS